MRLQQLQTSFVSGTLDAAASARSETALYRNGAAALLNCRLLTAGGAVTRWGTWRAAALSGEVVLHPFQFSLAQSYVAAFRNGAVDFFYAADGAPAGGLTGCPWTGAQLRSLRVSQGGDTMFVAHPDFEMRVIRRTGTASWTITPIFDFYPAARARPTWRYAPASITVQAVVNGGVGASKSVTLNSRPTISGLPVYFVGGHRGRARLNSGDTWKGFSVSTVDNLTLGLVWESEFIAPGTAAEWQFMPSNTGTFDSTIVSGTTAAAPAPDRIVFSADVLVANHAGRVIRMRDESVSSGAYRYAAMHTIHNAREAGVYWDGAAASLNQPTALWEEEAFSPVRGWQRSVTLYQQRLVIGGSRDAGDAMWLSRSGQPFNFDLGDGLASHAIAINVSGTDIRTINHVAPGRYLTIFTEAAVYACRESQNEGITPANIAIRQLAPFGVGDARPGELDGGLLMVQNQNSVVRDIAFEDEIVNLQAVPISAPVSLSMRNIIETAFMTAGRQAPEQYGFFLDAGGACWVLHSARTQRIAAWAQWTTAGQFKSLCVAGGNLFAAVLRGTTWTLERFADDTPFDSTVSLSYDTAQQYPILVPSAFPDGTIMHGVATTSGQPMDYLGSGAVVGGRVRLTRQEGEIPDYGSGVGMVGLAFDWWIDPLPPAVDMPDGTLLTRFQRVTRTSLLLTGAYSVQMDQTKMTLFSDGMTLGNAPAPLGGWWQARHLGWSRATEQARLTRRITRDAPLPVGVLAMMREVML